MNFLEKRAVKQMSVSSRFHLVADKNLISHIISAEVLGSNGSEYDE
jgi:hypothetical protein